jgi:hypothetical protein
MTYYNGQPVYNGQPIANLFRRIAFLSKNNAWLIMAETVAC